MKLTQKELGERTGYAEISIRQIEAGTFVPGLARLEGIATTLGVDISRLFCSEVVPSEYPNGPSMEWVDIKEEKPQECGKKYIVATSAGIVKTMRYKQEALIACGDGFGNKNGGYHKSNVVLWMDMPPIWT